MTSSGSRASVNTLSLTSQLLLRNLPRLIERATMQVVLINPPADQLSQHLEQEDIHNLHVSTSDYYIYQYIKRLNEDSTLSIEFTKTAQTSVATSPKLAIVFLPREKPFLEYLLSNCVSMLEPGDTIWLVGENVAGIKSAGKRLAQLAGSASKLDSARHCSLLEAIIDRPATDAVENAQLARRDFEYEFNNQNWIFTTLPGVFSYGRMDPASHMLLESISAQPVKGHVLDFACGCGVIGLCAQSLQTDMQLDLLDVNAMALTSTTINIHNNQIDAININVLASDAYSAIKGRYDAIISNPPFHRHIRQTLEVGEQLITQAPHFLNSAGELRIVANRHLPYLELFHKTFRNVEILAADNNFHVIRGKYPLKLRT